MCSTASMVTTVSAKTQPWWLDLDSDSGNRDLTQVRPRLFFGDFGDSRLNLDLRWSSGLTTILALVNLLKGCILVIRQTFYSSHILPKHLSGTHFWPQQAGVFRQTAVKSHFPLPGLQQTSDTVRDQVVNIVEHLTVKESEISLRRW